MTTALDENGRLTLFGGQRMPEPRAVLFDCEGTLLEASAFDHAVAATEAELLDLLGIPEGDRPAPGQALRGGWARALPEYVRRPFYLYRDLLADMFMYAADGLGRPLSPDQVAVLSASLVQHASARSSLRVGAIETISALRARGLHVGAVSNSDDDQFEAMLSTGGLVEHLDSSLCSEAARSCKPDPGIFQQALGRAGCSPAETIFVGDRIDADITGAEALGMRAVLIHPPQGAVARIDAAGSAGVSIRALPELLTML